MHRVYSLLFLFAVFVVANAQLLKIPQEEFRKSFENSQNRAEMFHLMFTDTIPECDMLGEYLIYHKDYSLVSSRKEPIKWKISEDKISFESFIKEETRNEQSLLNTKNGTGDSIQLPDGEYLGIKSALPYYGLWVSREGATFHVKNGRVILKSEWPEQKDVYFKLALSETKRREGIYLRTEEEVKILAQRLSSILLSASLNLYVQKHPLLLADTTGFSLRCIATIGDKGKISLECAEKKLGAHHKELFQRAKEWIETLPSFAFNGYYTLDGRYLPFRVLSISHIKGETRLSNSIELTKRFESYLKPDDL